MKVPVGERYARRNRLVCFHRQDGHAGGKLIHRRGFIDSDKYPALCVTCGSLLAKIDVEIAVTLGASFVDETPPRMEVTVYPHWSFTKDMSLAEQAAYLRRVFDESGIKYHLDSVGCTSNLVASDAVMEEAFPGYLAFRDKWDEIWKGKGIDNDVRRPVENAR